MPDPTTLLDHAERLLPIAAVVAAVFTPYFDRWTFRAIERNPEMLRRVIDALYQKRMAHTDDAIERLTHDVQSGLQAVGAISAALEALASVPTQMAQLAANVEAATTATGQLSESVAKSAAATERLTGRFDTFEKMYDYDRRSTIARPFDGPDRRGGGS